MSEAHERRGRTNEQTVVRTVFVMGALAALWISLAAVRALFRTPVTMGMTVPQVEAIVGQPFDKFSLPTSGVERRLYQRGISVLRVQFKNGRAVETKSLPPKWLWWP